MSPRPSACPSPHHARAHREECRNRSGPPRRRRRSESGSAPRDRDRGAHARNRTPENFHSLNMGSYLDNRYQNIQVCGWESFNSKPREDDMIALTHIMRDPAGLPLRNGSNPMDRKESNSILTHNRAESASMTRNSITGCRHGNVCRDIFSRR